MKEELEFRDLFEELVGFQIITRTFDNYIIFYITTSKKRN